MCPSSLAIASRVNPTGCLRPPLARRILDLIKPTHTSFNFESTLVGLGEDGVRCLLEGLRDRSRSTAGEWAHFSVEAFFLAIDPGPPSDDTLEVDQVEDLFQSMSDVSSLRLPRSSPY